jgi:pseudouridine synthase
MAVYRHNMSLERLQKILAQSGVASRRTAENFIRDGRVRVNGEVVRTLGAKADLGVDVVEVDGVGRLEREPHVYIALHKPEHVITSARDPEGRVTVIDVLERSRARGGRRFEGALPRVFPVGRLDFDAEGLVLLTNDGLLAQQLGHPRYHVPKTYTVKVRGRPEDRALERLQHGVRIRDQDGRMKKTKPAEVQVIRYSPANTWLELTITEGRHHQVKLMCAAIGHPVVRLVRTDFGGIELDDLPAGAWRFLANAEVERLRAWSSGRPPAQPASKAQPARARPTSRTKATTGKKKPSKKRAATSATTGKKKPSKKRAATSRRKAGSRGRAPARRQ